MKLRIKGNTIRLRLSQTEVEQVARDGNASETTRFPNGELLKYSIEAGEKFGASFENNEVLITLREDEIKPWADSDQVSLGGELTLSKGEILSILVEKDFKCLTVRPEDESDLFPNPQKSH